jgi:hypothetical protein
MIKADPIIAVKDVEASSEWYQTLLGCKRIHGGEGRFAVLTNEQGSVLLCLHKWGEDQHPTMMDKNITPGNGLILYFRTNDLEKIRENAGKLEAGIEEDIHLNSNSKKEEFSLRDLDGYYVTITRYHEYEG